MSLWKPIIIPVAILILIVGLVLPVFNLIQEERCSLIFSEITNSDIFDTGIPMKEIISNHPEQIAYLMKHPRQTLKNCIAFEDANPDIELDKLNIELAKMAFKAETGMILSVESLSLKAALNNAGYEISENITQ